MGSLGDDKLITGPNGREVMSDLKFTPRENQFFDLKAGETRDADQLVTSGLKVGETVVLSPPKTLKDGGRVTIKKG